MKGLFVILLVFFLGLTIFQFLADRISSLQIWKSPLFLKWETPLIVIGVIGSLVVMVAWMRPSNIKRLQDIQDYARNNGWTFSLQDTEGLKERIEHVFYDRIFNPSCIRTIETGDRTISLFDCSHKHRKAMANLREHRATGCLIESPRFSSVIEPLVINEGLLINETLIGQKVRLDDSPFSRQFVVHSMAPATARQALNPALQSLILKFNEGSPNVALQVAIGPSGAVVLTKETMEHNRWQHLIQFARDVESAVDGE